MTYFLTIPHVPPSGNMYHRMHWREQQDLIGAWGLLVANAIQKAGRARFDQFRFSAVINFKDARMRDLPNYITTLDKLVLDNLTHQGVIVNDDSKHLKEIRLRFEIDPDPRTEVTLEEL
jgi:hypothetical protein